VTKDQSVWCEWAWLGRETADSGVVIEIDGGRISSVTAGIADAPPEAVRRLGLTLPGLVNAHSHVFHRALRGRTNRGPGSFWTWREQMYELSALLDPDSMYTLARATYGEMALAGITTVGEFHYLHHGADGRQYLNPNEMGQAVAAAARAAGVRLTLIDACYLQGGVARPVEGVQLRFSDASAEAWGDRVAAIESSDEVRVGAAIHSVRAVPPEAMAEIAHWAAERSLPLHAHVSEQPAENAACVEAYGKTPTRLLRDAGASGSSFTAVHAVHVTDEDLSDLRGATVCLCPTTERDLADGIAPSGRMREGGVAVALGSDSNAVIDLFEEARAVELDTRSATGARGTHTAASLLQAATAGGARSLGWDDAGTISVGALADLVTVGLDSVRLAGLPGNDLLDGVVFAGGAPDVTHVMVGGREIVRDGAHVTIDVSAELRQAVREAWRES
jgi:formiminoglutamate deiminase